MKMKKYAWLVALLAIFAIGFVGFAGCGGETLKIDDIPEGPGVDPDPDPDPDPDGPTKVKVKVLKYTQAASWSGFDFLDSYYNFDEGFVITASGQVLEWEHNGGQYPAGLVFGLAPGGWNDDNFEVDFEEDLDEEGFFEFDWELEDDVVGGGTGGAPDGIRITGNNVNADTVIVLFFEIVIEDDTGKVVFDLAEALKAKDLGTIDLGAGAFPGVQNAGPAVFEVVEVEIEI